MAFSAIVGIFLDFKYLSIDLDFDKFDTNPRRYTNLKLEFRFQEWQIWAIFECI